MMAGSMEEARGVQELSAAESPTTSGSFVKQSLSGDASDVQPANRPQQASAEEAIEVDSDPLGRQEGVNAYTASVKEQSAAPAASSLPKAEVPSALSGYPSGALSSAGPQALMSLPSPEQKNIPMTTRRFEQNDSDDSEDSEEDSSSSESDTSPAVDLPSKPPIQAVQPLPRHIPDDILFAAEYAEVQAVSSQMAMTQIDPNQFRPVPPSANEVDEEESSEDEDELEANVNEGPDLEHATKSGRGRKTATEVEGEDSTEPPKTAHEVVQAPVQKVEITILPEHQLELAGTVLHVNKQELVAVVRGLADSKALDVGSILCFESKDVLGAVDDVFGPVSLPMYTIRFESVTAIPEGAVGGASVFCVTNYSTFVNPETLHTKGSDASNLYDEEPDSDDVEFSDDEAEAAAKAAKKARKRNRNRADLDKTQSDATSSSRSVPSERGRGDQQSYQPGGARQEGRKQNGQGNQQRYTAHNGGGHQRQYREPRHGVQAGTFHHGYHGGPYHYSQPQYGQPMHSYPSHPYPPAAPEVRYIYVPVPQMPDQAGYFPPQQPPTQFPGYSHGNITPSHYPPSTYRSEAAGSSYTAVRPSTQQEPASLVPEYSLDLPGYYNTPGDDEQESHTSR